jgi:hypothetical protein
VPAGQRAAGGLDVAQAAAAGAPERPRQRRELAVQGEHRDHAAERQLGRVRRRLGVALLDR